MKKVFMSLAIVADMFAAASCACCNNNAPAEEPAAQVDSTACCDSCASCDSAAADCAQKAE